MSAKKGFTILEIALVVLFASLLAIFGILQKQNVDAMRRDEQRKIAINAMYYALEESFYPQNGYYPESISADNITVIDPALWTDPAGYALGDPASSYFYEPANCSEGKCREYTLRAQLEKEDAYIKNNRN